MWNRQRRGDERRLPFRAGRACGDADRNDEQPSGSPRRSPEKLGRSEQELLLVKKALRCRADIDGSRIGLLGHSGGAVVGNLAVRVDTSWNAYVGDLTGDYLDWDSNSRTAIDELAPHVFPLWELINDFKTAEVPVLMLPYGFGETSDAMLAFYREHL